MTTTMSASGEGLPTTETSVTVSTGRTTSAEITIVPLDGSTVVLGAAPPLPSPVVAGVERLTGVATAVSGPVTFGTGTNSPPTGRPVISGTPRVGETLTASISEIADADGLDNGTFAYQWLANDGADDTEIAGATDATQEVAPAQVGKALKVRVTFTDDGDNEETLTSIATERVAARAPDAPGGLAAATGLPEISGTAQVGEMLTASVDDIEDADGLDGVTFAYQWIANDGADDSEIEDATGATHEVAPAEVGGTLKVRVTFTDAGGTEETLTSVATEVVVAAPTEVSVRAKAAYVEEGANAAEHVVPLFLSASNAERESFVRVINRSLEGGERRGKVRIVATDDSGWQPLPLTLTIEAHEAVHFNSADLEEGNVEKGLAGVAGSPVKGDWHLRLESGLDLEVLSYSRTRDGMLSSMHDTVPEKELRYRVPIFNPGGNVEQVSRLRLVNPGVEDAQITIRGIDDNGRSPGADVRVTIPGGTARTYTAQELESGSAAGLDDGIGDGFGKWQLMVSTDQPLWVMSLLQSPTGHLTNLSSAGPDGHSVHRVDLFPPASDPRQQGFVRVINHGDTSGTVNIRAFDDTDRVYEVIELAVEGGRTVHFNSTDLEDGNADKGLPEGVGPGTGPWRLQLESDLDIEVLSYIRTRDGFLTSIHDLVPPAVARHRVSTFIRPGT